VDWICQQAPDAIMLYGCGIIRRPLLEVFGDRTINLHLGLSPYYRGSATNFWPLVNREPECVGATIHLATARVDAGAVLTQVRPLIEPQDGPHDIGAKTILAAANLLPEILALYLRQRIRPQRQDLSCGREYKTKDFTAAAVQRMRSHFETGMVEEFLDDRDRRCQRYPIVQQINAPIVS
jgi:methionyl-tRNA formyltransferase